MSMNDFNHLKSSCADERTEFRLVDEEIVVELVNSHSYSKENAEAMKKKVPHLLNHSSAIQRKANLETAIAVQIEVTSASSKCGTAQVSVYRDHANCVCGKYKDDRICKHSLAVAALMSILCADLNFIREKVMVRWHLPNMRSGRRLWGKKMAKKICILTSEEERNIPDRHCCNHGRGESISKPIVHQDIPQREFIYLDFPHRVC